MKITRILLGQQACWLKSKPSIPSHSLEASPLDTQCLFLPWLYIYEIVVTNEQLIYFSIFDFNKICGEE
jgi:hypothetical protein